MEQVVKIDNRADIEIINFDDDISWVRWYLPDFSNNGNIDLPKGNWKLKSRDGDEVIVEKI